MRINIISTSISSINTANNGANVQGDEMVARAWHKYMSRDHRVSEVHLNGPSNIQYDVSIAFSPLVECTSGYKILYLQNVFPKPHWPGTVGMFQSVSKNYNNFIFPSDGLKNDCNSDGLVCQFAVDPEIFYPRSPSIELQHNLCFVGNNIRDAFSLNRYLLCTADMGLVIYGNPHGWNSDLCHGKISVEEEATLYSSAKICLNTHLTEHLEYGSFNFRIFNILACKGFIISDESVFLKNEFDKAIVFTDGFSDLRDKANFYLNNPYETLPFREYGYQHILNNHTFKHRTTSIIDWLERLI